MASSQVFKCSLCEKIFGSNTELKTHTTSHTKEKPHKCPTCSAAFGFLGNLIHHVRAVHEGVANFRCQTCDYKCYARSMMKTHSMIHSTERPFSCTVTGCSYSTKHRAALGSHLRFVHNKIRPFKCQYNGCSFKTIGSSQLREHATTHSNERNFVCTFPGCSKPFKRKSDLKQHISIIHNEIKPFKCSTCDFETKYKTVLRKHENRHRDSDTKRFHCQVPNCNYASEIKTNTQRHFDSKHRKKDILCTYSGCSYKCGSIAVLKNHSRWYHMRPIFKCPQDPCNCSTRKPEILDKHLSCRHGNNQSTSLDLPKLSGEMTSGQAVEWNRIVCPLPSCDYQTQFPHLYDHHRRTHEEENLKYSCNFCSMRFSSPNLLETHIRRHTGERPYSCSKCDYTAISIFHLRVHAKKRHGIALVPGEEKKGVNICKLCRTLCMSYNELVLHSMKHLQVVVVLERLRVKSQ